MSDRTKAELFIVLAVFVLPLLVGAITFVDAAMQVGACGLGPAGRPC